MKKSKLMYLTIPSLVILTMALASCGGGGGGGSNTPPPTITADFCVIQPAKSAYILPQENACSIAGAEPFRTHFDQLYSTIGTYNAGLVFLGCDMGRLVGSIPSDLSAYDGIVMFNISGQNIDANLNFDSTKPFVAMTNMDNGGGSNITMSPATAAPRSRVVLSHFLKDSGGSNVSFSNAITRDKAYFKSCNSGGSNFQLNGSSAVQGELITVP